MEASKSPASERKNYLLIGTVVITACVLLFFLDKDVNSISDLLRNSIALLMYVVPVFFLCFFLYGRFLRKKARSESLMLALSVGIPVGIVSVIVMLRLLMWLYP